MDVHRIMHKIKWEHVYLALIVLIIVCFFQYGIRKVCGFSAYPDEFGYWASAAKTVGYDWTEVASLGSYYSFGYSLLLMPVLKIFSDGVVAYRAAIAVNMMLMCVSVLIMYNISFKLFPEIDKVKRVFISGIAVLYPSWILYMQMTLAEALLMFLFLIVVYLFISLFQKPRIMTAIFLAIVLMYSYCVHMRTIGVVIASLAVLLLWGITNPAMKKPIIILLGVVAIAGLTVLFIKRNVILSVFPDADSETLAANDYASQIVKIRDIFTFAGMKHFIKEIIAKIFYLGIATFGFFYWAMGWCLKKTAILWKKIIRKRADGCTLTEWIAMFLLLAVIGEVLICSIFMHNSTLIDCLVYGRYNEFLVPVLILIGIIVMFKSRWIFCITLFMGAISGLMLLPIFSAIEEGNMSRIRGYFIAGISYFLKGEDADPYIFFLEAWIFGLILMIMVAAVVFFTKKWEKVSWLLGIIIALEIVLGVQASTKYAYHANRFGFQDLIISEKILERKEEDIRVTYLEEGTTPYIDFLQMQLQEIPIHVIRGEITEQADNLGDFLIVSYQTEKQEEIERLYNRHITANLHTLYYNQAE